MKLLCIGRNYAAHARELGNAVPEAPMFFLKPSTAVVPLGPDFAIPAGRGRCHHETEITVRVGRRLSGAVREQDVRDAIDGIGLGLDLTLRDVQDVLKAKGHPWEVAKAFDGSAPLSPFLDPVGFPDLQDIRFALDVNGVRRQTGHSADMSTGIVAMIQAAAAIFTLEPGDVVMTGTPAGVAALQSGDALTLTLGEQAWTTRVR